MSVVQSSILGNLKDNDEIQKKMRLIEIATVPRSELPIRVTKKNTGVTLGQFENGDDALTFIENYSLEQLSVVPTRKKRR